MSLRLAPVNGLSAIVPVALPGNDTPTLLLSMWQRWDATWYEPIARDGYHANNGTAHFLPLYPLLSHITARSLHIPIVLGELAVSSVAFGTSMWLMYKLARIDVKARTARLAVLLIACSPEAFFLLAPYTESVYLALTLGAFWFARGSRPWLAGTAGFLAALTRVQAIFLVLPLAYEYLYHRRAEGSRPGIGLAAAFLPLMGVIGWNLYLHVVVGEPASGLQLAAQWGTVFRPPWQIMPQSIRWVIDTGDPIEIINLVSLLGAALLALYLVEGLRLAYALYVWPYLIFLFSTQLLVSPYASAARYCLPLFPCFILLACKMERRAHLAGGLLALGIMTQAFLFEHFVHVGFVA